MAEKDALGTEGHLSRGSDDLFLCVFFLLSLFPAHPTGHMILLLTVGSNSLALMIP